MCINCDTITNMKKTELVHIRVEPKTKKEVESIFSILGINTSYATNLYYKQVILNKGIPFKVEIPEEEIKLHKQKVTKLTIMCMVYNDDGSFLVENRLKKDWPGITFPGGHVEDNETIEEAVIREMKEETGLTVSSLEPQGFIEWNNFGDDVRHLAMLYRTKEYQGEIKSSKEGEIFFLKEDDLKNYLLSNDFMEIYYRMRGKS